MQKFASNQHTSKFTPALQEEAADVPPTPIIVAIIHCFDAALTMNYRSTVAHPKAPQAAKKRARRVLRVGDEGQK